MTANRPRRIIAVALALVGALVVGLIAVLASRADGYATTSVDLSQRSVWVTNSQKFMVGRINRQIDELDSAAVLDSGAMDVLQQGDTVVVIDGNAHQARLLDPATVVLGGRLTLPADASIALGGGRLAVVDRQSGAAWIRPATSISSGELASDEPSARLSPGAVVAISATGSVAAAAPGGTIVTVLGATTDGAVVPTSIAVPGTGSRMPARPTAPRSASP